MLALLLLFPVPFTTATSAPTGLPSAAPATAAQPTNATVTNLLDGITVRFSSPTAAISSCLDYLSVASLALLGTNPSCSLPHPYTSLTLTFGANAIVVPGDTLDIRAYTEAGIEVEGAYSTIVVGPPKNPGQVVVSSKFRPFSFIGPCELNTMLRTTVSSTGYAAKPRPQSLKISFLLGNSTADMAAAAVWNATLQSLVVWNASARESVKLLARDIPTGTHSVVVIARNWAGVEGRVTVMLTREVNPRLLSSIPPHIHHFRTMPLEITVRLASPSCMRNVGYSPIKPKGMWMQLVPGLHVFPPGIRGFESQVTTEAIQMPGSDKFNIKFPRDALQMGLTYAFLFRGRLQAGNTVRTNASSPVFIFAFGEQMRTELMLAHTTMCMIFIQICTCMHVRLFFPRFARSKTSLSS